MLHTPHEHIFAAPSGLHRSGGENGGGNPLPDSRAAKILQIAPARSDLAIDLDQNRFLAGMLLARPLEMTSLYCAVRTGGRYISIISASQAENLGKYEFDLLK
jgi:hypothetical protein